MGRSSIALVFRHDMIVDNHQSYSGRFAPRRVTVPCLLLKLLSNIRQGSSRKIGLQQIEDGLVLVTEDLATVKRLRK